MADLQAVSVSLYRKLLLPLQGSPAGLAALEAGLVAARIMQAHLAAVTVRLDSREVAPLAGEGLSGAMIEDMMDAADRDGADREAAMRVLFEAAALRHGVPATGKGATASLEQVTGRESEIVPARARLSDLAILAHPARGASADNASASECLHTVLFDSGRPVLIAPHVAVTGIGRRCCVAWNGTVEGSAALAAMLPWLRRAEAVRVLHAGDYQRRGPPAADVLPYLALHGVRADLAEFGAVDRDVGAGLLTAAADFGADLLGMGAYSHSRLRQLILGGVTRHVLENATLPVLMSR